MVIKSKNLYKWNRCIKSSLRDNILVAGTETEVFWYNSTIAMATGVLTSCVTTRINFNYLRHVCLENDRKWKKSYYVYWNKFSTHDMVKSHKYAYIRYILYAWLPISSVKMWALCDVIRALLHFYISITLSLCKCTILIHISPHLIDEWSTICALHRPCKSSDWIAKHYSDFIMGAMGSQITIFTTVKSTVYSGAN